MPLNALKASWIVQGGIIPGESLPNFTKTWSYTSADAEIDRTQNTKPEDQAIFSKRRAEAMDYYLQISVPHILNWATVSFMWY